MSSTLPGSILDAVTTSLSSAPPSSELPASTPLPNFAWPKVLATLTTCTSATVEWSYSGIPDSLQFTLVPQRSPPTEIANGIDSATLTWTWTKVNASAGEYRLQAAGTRVVAVSSSFAIINGTDTSCLAAAVNTATASATLTTPSPESSVTPIPTTSSRETANIGVIAGGAVGGVVVLIIALLGYRVWARRHRQRLIRSRYPARAAHADLLSPYAASTVDAPPHTEKGDGSIDPLDRTAAESDPPLVANRRLPPSLLSSPSPPAPSYTPHTQTREQTAGSLMDVSTIGSRSSAALSNATSTAGLMRTISSSCPPSYLTSPSPPPPYVTVTHAIRDAKTLRSPQLKYARSL